MKKVFIVMFALLALSLSPVQAKTDKVGICHIKGNGDYVHLMVDDDGAYSGHIHHDGDIYNVETCPTPTEPTATSTATSTDVTPTPTNTTVIPTATEVLPTETITGITEVPVTETPVVSSTPVVPTPTVPTPVEPTPTEETLVERLPDTGSGSTTPRAPLEVLIFLGALGLGGLAIRYKLI